MSDHINNALGWIALAAMVYGISLWSYPAAWVFGGAGLMIVAVVGVPVDKDKRGST